MISIAVVAAGFTFCYGLWETFPRDVWVRVPGPRERGAPDDFRYEPGGEALDRDYIVSHAWEPDDSYAPEPVQIVLPSMRPLRRLLTGCEAVTYRNPKPHVSVPTPHGEWWRFVRQD